MAYKSNEKLKTDLIKISLKNENCQIIQNNKTNNIYSNYNTPLTKVNNSDTRANTVIDSLIENFK
jgi:hypothetical protein